MDNSGYDYNLNRRQFLAMLAGCSLAQLLLPGCTPSKPLVIAGHVWPGYEFMFLARHEGWLPNKEIVFLETTSATGSLTALAEGKVDGAALTLDEVLRARNKGIPLTVILVFDVSVGADVVLARSHIKSIRDLAGKRIGVEQSALGALMLQKVTEASGHGNLKADIVYTTPDMHLADWNKGKLDAIITYEPVATQIQAKGANRIFDSRKMPDTIFDVLAVKPAEMRSQSRRLSHLVSAHFKALHHFKANRQDAVYRMSTRLKLRPDEVVTAFRGLELPDVNSNHNYLGGAHPNILSAAKMLSGVMVKAGILSCGDNLTGLVSDDFLPPEDM